MIACDRALVYRGHTNRLTWASLGCYLIRRRCSRQRKLANPLIRKGQTLKKYLHIRQLSFALFVVFVTVFFPFSQTIFFYLPQKSPRATFCHFCSRFALSLLDKTLTPVKGWKNKQTNKLVCRLAFPYPFLPASKRWRLHRQNNSNLAQVSLPADWFIVHLGIVVT